MSPALWIAWIAIAIAVLMPVSWAWRMAFYYWRTSRRPAPANPRYPIAAVILPVRGADPSLPRCIRGLLRQDYPNYSVHIVVDHESDPAGDVVRSVLAADNERNVDVRVGVLRERLGTCGLKVSSQLQALQELDAEVEVVAFVDADSVPAADWLESLALPLADPKVGTTTGMRWFAPRDSSWGSMVRHMFNAGSQSQMFIFRIPWGGSMAMRRETMLRAKLPEHWAQCFCEDTSSYGPLYKLGVRNVWVPAATQFNEESLEMAGASRFIFRQLLCVRLHTRLWWPLFFWNMANALALSLAAIGAVVAGCLRHWDVAVSFGSLVAAYTVGMVVILIIGERMFRGNMLKRLDHVPPYPPIWKLIPAIILAQSISMRHLVKCITAPSVDWRGVTYALEGG